MRANVRLHLPVLGSWRSLEQLGHLRAVQLSGGAWAANAALSTAPWRQGLELLPSADVVGLNAAMAACRWRQAHDLLAQLPRRRLEPTVVSKGVAVKACGDVAQWRSALSCGEALRSAYDMYRCR